MASSRSGTPAKCTVCASDSAPKGNKNGFHIHQCPQCGLLFVSPLPDSSLDIYTQDYFEGTNDGHGYVDYDRDKQAMIPTFERYLDLLEKVYGKKGKILDVGAATGFFLDLARKRGWQTVGVEPSSHAAALGRAKGLDITTGTLDSLSSPDHEFDVITLWDVIEHTTDPRQVLQRVWRLLKPSGLIAINTPDADSVWAKMLGARWNQIVPPEHLHLFSARSLRRLLAETNFECVVVTRIGKTFTLRYIAQTLAHWQNIAVWRVAADRLAVSSLGKIGVPLDLRDNVFLLARSRP